MNRFFLVLYTLQAFFPKENADASGAPPDSDALESRRILDESNIN
jgi:hypothetical protein